MSGHLVSGTLDLYGECPHVDKCGGHTLVCRRQAAHLAISIRRKVAVVAQEIDVGARLLGRWAATIEPRDSHSDLGEGALAELEGRGSRTPNWRPRPPASMSPGSLGSAQEG